MGLPSDAEAVLHELAASGGSDWDLAEQLEDLLRHAVVAVPSCQAVSLTASRYGLPVTLTALTEPLRHQPVLSSLAVHLPAEATYPEPGGAGSRTLTFYAGAPGAFVSLTADLLALLDLDPRRAMIDGHLELPTDDDTGGDLRAQLAAVSATDLALGALLDKGLLPEAGQRELERLARVNRTTVDGAARLVLAAIRGPLPDSG